VKNSKYPTKYSGNFCLATGKTGTYLLLVCFVSVNYLSLCI